MSSSRSKVSVASARVVTGSPAEAIGIHSLDSVRSRSATPSRTKVARMFSTMPAGLSPSAIIDRASSLSTAPSCSAAWACRDRRAARSTTVATATATATKMMSAMMFSSCAIVNDP